MEEELLEEKPRKCDVCGNTFENESISVCSSTLGAMSFGYCRTCLNLGAEPYSGEDYDYLSYKNGQYVECGNFQLSDKDKTTLSIINKHLKSKEKFEDVENLSNTERFINDAIDYTSKYN